MARAEEARAVKVMKEAKTGEQKLRSWASQRPGGSMEAMEALIKRLKLWIDHKPEMIDAFLHRPLWEIMDRGVLDRKTRELIFLARFFVEFAPSGVIEHWQDAKAGGVTEEEVMEVAAMACYWRYKTTMVETCNQIVQAFKVGINVSLYDPNAYEEETIIDK